MKQERRVLFIHESQLHFFFYCNTSWPIDELGVHGNLWAKITFRKAPSQYQHVMSIITH